MDTCDNKKLKNNTSNNIGYTLCVTSCKPYGYALSTPQSTECIISCGDKEPIETNDEDFC